MSKSNVRVVVRFRPVNSREKKEQQVKASLVRLFAMIKIKCLGFWLMFGSSELK